MNDNASFLVLFLAPVKEYLADEKVSEILINGPSQIYIEREGKLEETDARFANEAQLKAAAVNIAKSVDRQLDETYARQTYDQELQEFQRRQQEIEEDYERRLLERVEEAAEELEELEQGELEKQGEPEQEEEGQREENGVEIPEIRVEIGAETGEPGEN